MAWNEATDTRRETILKKVTALLEVAGGPTDLLVHRFRGVPIEIDDLPASIPYPISDPAEGDTHDVTTARVLRIRIEHRVQGAGVLPTETSPDELLDPLFSWAHYQLLADRTLGGICTDVTPVGDQWDSVELDAHYGAGAQDFDIEYEHDESDLTTLNGG